MGLLINFNTVSLKNGIRRRVLWSPVTPLAQESCPR
jgi:hypothetical protein